MHPAGKHVRIPSKMPEPQDIPVTIRAFRPNDLDACRRLYGEGLVQGGKLSENDTGIDIDDIYNVYIRPSGNGFWVADNRQGEVVGMIGVQHHDEGVGEVRRLRVKQDHQRRGIGTKLLEKAIGFCEDNGYLKITLDTYVGRLPAIRLFEKFGFRLDHAKIVGGRELLYFYRDLYQVDQRQQQRRAQ